MAIIDIARKAASRHWWLSSREWSRAQFPRLKLDWDFVQVSRLYRVHRAWNPFLFERPSRAALATSDAPRALFYTYRDVPSDILPSGYSFLTEFEARADEKIVGDYQNDKILMLPTNPYVRRPIGVALAAQLAKIDSFRQQSNYSDIPYILQTAYLYEVVVSRRFHPITCRWVVRTTELGNEISILTPDEIRRIERLLRQKTTDVDAPLDDCRTPKSNTMPDSFDKYKESVRMAELQAHPIEILMYVLLLGFNTNNGLHALRSAFSGLDLFASLRRLAIDPHEFDSTVEIRNGRHAFSCLPELIAYVESHVNWLAKIAGPCDLKSAILNLFDCLLKIGVRPSNHAVNYCSEEVALNFDDKLTNGMLTLLRAISRN